MSSADDTRSKLEVFDGSISGNYRLWKRRARLLIAGLPTTVPEAKNGPRLMEFIKGEAACLLESLDVSELTKKAGDKLIWDVLDEKYVPMPRDLLQQAMIFFYDLQVRPSETYVQFLARFDAANRLPREQQVELPKPVLGYMLMKKMRLDSSQESMVLTHTQSALELEAVIKAIKGIFPEGKGAAKAAKEIFQMDGDTDEPGEVRVLEEQEDFQEAADYVEQGFQERGGEDDEEALETFETYVNIRQKLREQKNGRGYTRVQEQKTFSGRPGGGDSWKLQGTVRGRLELLKSKTTCHYCRQKGLQTEGPLEEGMSSQNSFEEGWRKPSDWRVQQLGSRR